MYRHTYATRLNSFRTSTDPFDSMRAAARVPGITAVEINFPEHITPASAKVMLGEARGLGLEVTALNLRYDPKQYLLGAFSNPDPKLRAQAIAETVAAADLAADTGIPHVILWMGPDGFDYPFANRYDQLWDWELEGFREVATRQPTIQFSIEYKPSDPRRFALIRSMGDALLAVKELNLPNLGTTLDFCHSLMAGENPATAAALALRTESLFGLHLNDGFGIADDGLMVGSVHQRQTLELLWVLRSYGWDRPIYFDTFPTNVDPYEECVANIAMVEHLEAVLDRIDGPELAIAQSNGDAIAVETLLAQALAG